MNFEAEYYEQQKRQWLSAFAQHKAAEGKKGLHWAAPNTSNYACTFIMEGHYLIVIGDCGEAIYQWSQKITAPFLFSLDFSYFHSKCQASEAGKEFKTWDPRIAYARAVNWLKDQNARGVEEKDREDQEVMEQVATLIEGSGEEDYMAVAHEINNISGAYELCSEIMNFGKVPHPWAIGHFVGVQMAIKQRNLEIV